MSYGPPPPQYYGPQQPDNSKKFLNMSGGIMALAIAAIVLIPVICCGLCMVAGVLGPLTGAGTPTPTP